MKWIKTVVVDIIVTLFIIAALWVQSPWMWWLLIVYTALILIAKVISASSEGLMRKSKSGDAAPLWFFHLLYFINIVLLGFAGWWYLFVGWCAIWLLSYLAERNNH